MRARCPFDTQALTPPVASDPSRSSRSSRRELPQTTTAVAVPHPDRQWQYVGGQRPRRTPNASCFGAYHRCVPALATHLVADLFNRPLHSDLAHSALCMPNDSCRIGEQRSCPRQDGQTLSLIPARIAPENPYKKSFVITVRSVCCSTVCQQQSGQCVWARTSCRLVCAQPGRIRRAPPDRLVGRRRQRPIASGFEPLESASRRRRWRGTDRPAPKSAPMASKTAEASGVNRTETRSPRGFFGCVRTRDPMIDWSAGGRGLVWRRVSAVESAHRAAIHTIGQLARCASIGYGRVARA